MRRADDSNSGRLARLRELNRWRSPLRVHYGAYLVVAGLAFVVLLAVGVPVVASLIVGLALGTAAEYAVDWRWKRDS